MCSKGRRETIPHITSDCTRFKDFYSKRHNRIMKPLEVCVEERYGKNRVWANKLIPRSILKEIPGSHLPPGHRLIRENPPKPDLLIIVPQKGFEKSVKKSKIIIFEFKCPTEKRQKVAEEGAEEDYKMTKIQFVREGWNEANVKVITLSITNCAYVPKDAEGKLKSVGLEEEVRGRVLKKMHKIACNCLLKVLKWREMYVFGMGRGK